MRYRRFFTMALSLGLLAPGAARAAAPEKYTIQPLLKIGEKVGDTSVLAQHEFVVSTLSDNGQLLFMVANSTGNALMQYADGKYTPLILRGQPSPFGTWPGGNLWAWSPVDSNPSGSAVMRAESPGRAAATLFWDASAGTMTTLAQAGTPLPGDLVAVEGLPQPTINNRGDIVFPAEVRDAAGKQSPGLFFREADGKLQLIARSGQPGADGVPIFLYWPVLTSINDAGRVAFLARRQGHLQAGAYTWEKGVLGPAVLPGTAAPGGGTIVEVVGVWLNNRNQNLLIEAVLDHVGRGLRALYLWDGAQLKPVAIPRQPMPGGGQFATLPFQHPLFLNSVSFANELGQHAFYARVTEEGRSFFAAYLMDADGTLSRIVKPGDDTEIGRITRVGEVNGWGIALNRQGEVALTVRAEGGPSTLVLLRPVAASPGASEPAGN